MNEMKAWEIYETDIIAAPDLETALAWYCEEMGTDRPEPEDIVELELSQSMTFTHGGFGPLPEPFTRSIAEMIEQQKRIGGAFPAILWTSEW
jgi:hypothetical protein